METIKKLMCVVTFAALGIVNDASAQDVPPEQALAVRQAVVAWLECEECTEGQLEGVLKQGALAVPTLAAALERGPSPASLEKVRMHLEQTHRNLVEYARTHDEVKVELGEEEYVKLYLENYRANYGIRAAQALGKLGGDGARKSLESAVRLPLRDDVKRAAAESVKRLSR
jgi:hypothetical protein